MGESCNGMRHGIFAAWIVVVVVLGLLQSVVHLAVVLGADRVGTSVDLDRSNGLPDLVSTAALAAAACGSLLLAREEAGARRSLATTLVGILAILAFADLLHDGPHPASATGWFVIAVVVGAGALLALVAASSGFRTRVTITSGGYLLVCSFLVTGLDQVDQWFERKRGDPVVEYQIVAKEGLELLGWSLVALALWDECLRRRALHARRTVRGNSGATRRPRRESGPRSARQSARLEERAPREARATPINPERFSIDI